MFKKIIFGIENLKSENDKTLLETKIDILEGVKDVSVNLKEGIIFIEFEDDKVSEGELIEKIKKLGFNVLEKTKKESLAQQEHVFYIKGMHCASCEILIEKKLLELEGIKSAEASTSQGKVKIVYEGKLPEVDKLNYLFKKEGYLFSNKPFKEERGSHSLTALATAFLVIILFFLLKNSRFAALVNVSANSSLPTFFVLGLIAGVSSCAALVGGLILSLAKQWQEVFVKSNSTFEKLQPHLMFNLGRIFSYGFFGGLIGVLGKKLQISLGFTSFLIFLVSFLMIGLGFQMLGVKVFRKFQVATPKFITRYIANERKFQGKYMPSLLGVFTFFLPCGFTLTVQGLALISGNFLQSALIMIFFALGTTPGLLAIGFSSVKFLEKSHLSNQFLKVAGILVLFFALYNINSQLNLLGFPSLSDIKLSFNNQIPSKENSSSEEGLAPIINGKQIIKMKASSYSYKPNYFKVKVGIPVRWEIEDIGTSGCTNAIVSKGLFLDEIPLTPGQISVKEFTPTKPGKYKFSCWMGMVSGIIEVVDTKTAVKNNNIISSGASGCGCGGGK